MCKRDLDLRIPVKEIPFLRDQRTGPLEKCCLQQKMHYIAYASNRLLINLRDAKR